MVLYKTISFNLLVIYLVYSVPRFCFHVLHNISIIIDTFAPKLNPFIGMKIAQIFSFETSVLIQNQKLECLRGFCIAKDMKVPRVTTLNNCARYTDSSEGKKDVNNSYFETMFVFVPMKFSG